MIDSFTTWLTEILASFDGSDFFAFVAGCLAMILYQNVKAIMINRNKRDHRHINLPKLNRKYFIWVVVFASMLGIMWSTSETSRAQKELAQSTQGIAIAVCENAKVSGVERKGLQDLFFALLNIPPEIRALPQDDPTRQAYGQQLGLNYLALLDDASQQRDRVQAGKGIDPDFWERYFGPDYPEPDCNPAAHV
jgi:hypothetical protein